MAYDIEKALLTKVLEGQDLQTVIRAKITKLEDEDYQTVFEWVRDQVDEYGKVPSITLVQEQFPDFEPEETDDELEAIVKSIQNKRLYGALQRGVKQVATEAEEDPESGLHVLRELAQKTLDHTTTSAVDITQGADEVLRRFKLLKKKQGLVGIPWPWAELNKATHGICEGTFNMLYGPEGCIRGDAFIGYSIWKGEKRINHKGGSLEGLYRRFNGLDSHHRRARGNLEYRTAVRDDEGRIRSGRIVGVICTGVKPTLELRVGKLKVVATPNHEFLTPSGWVALEDLRVGDLVECHINAPFRKSGKKEKKRRVRWWVKSYRKGARAVQINGKYRYFSVPRARAVVEADMNGLSLNEFRKALNSGKEGLKFLSPSVDVHHRNENTLDDRLENLVVESHSEHARYHAVENQKNLRFKTVTRRITSISPKGCHPVYDIQMEAPFHNFVANKIVAHNSMKTWLLIACGVHANKMMGTKVIMFSPELTAEQVRWRWVALRAGIDYTRINSGDLSDKEKKRFEGVLSSMEREEEDPFIVESLEETGPAALIEIEAKIKEHSPGLVLMDSISYAADDDEWSSLSKVSRGVKRIMTRNRLAAIATHHTTRDGRRIKKQRDDNNTNDVALGIQLARDTDVFVRIMRTPKNREDEELELVMRKIREGLETRFVIHARPAISFDQKYVPHSEVEGDDDDEVDDS